MDSKIEQLTEKLLNEGVQRGKEQEKQIVEEANKTKAQIISEANKEAEEIREQAKRDAETLNKNTQSELKMFCEQAVNALKTEVADVVTDKIVKEAVAQAVDDKKFMQEFMLKLAEKWGAQEDIVISAEDAAGLKTLFAKKAKALLDKGVKINQVNGMGTDFSVEPADGAYKVKFGNKEFEEYFKAFLRPQLVQMLF